MSNELTEAERAAAKALRENPYGCHMNDEVCEECASAFRAIVAAVRPIIAAEALTRFADKVDALPPGGEALKGEVWYRDGLRDAATIARDDAAALRTTTSEETTDA